MNHVVYTSGAIFLIKNTLISNLYGLYHKGLEVYLPPGKRLIIFASTFHKRGLF